MSGFARRWLSPLSSEPRVNETAKAPAPGDVLAGKFRVERVVGRGGMGVVVEATNIQLDQRVALKLLATGGDDPAVVERFSHEARAAARLRSEHVARVYDVGRDPLQGPFIVMEMLEGRTLAELVATTGRVQVHRAVEYVIDACEGLAEAHARGIVHQDVKPGNLFLVAGDDGRPSIKVLDFGIAIMRSKERAGAMLDSSSGPRAALGTPAYLAPEQLRGSNIDHRADIWALGCVLYELLVGERPFRATRFTELITKILETPPHPVPSDLDVPSPVLAAIERCLQKDPTKRFGSTGHLALTLLPFARRRAHSSAARAVAHVKTGGLDPNLEMPSSMPPPPVETVELASGTNLRAAGVPSFSDTTARKAAPPTRSTRRMLALVIPLVLVFFGAALAWTRLAPRPVSAKPQPLPSTASSAPPVTPTMSAAEAGATPESSVHAGPPTTTSAAPFMSPPTTSAAPVTPAPRPQPDAPAPSPKRSVTTPSARPPSPESDIRLDR